MTGSQLLQCLLFLTFSLSCQNENKVKSWIALVPLSWHLCFLSNGLGKAQQPAEVVTETCNILTFSLVLIPAWDSLLQQVVPW